MRQYGNSIKLANTADIVLDTGTGSRIGTTVLQKLGFYGATPVIKPVAGTDIKQALGNLGLIDGPASAPLDLKGGTLTAGQGAFNSTMYIDGNNITQTSGTMSINVTSGTLNIAAAVALTNNYLTVYNTSSRRHEVMVFSRTTSDATATELTLNGNPPIVSNRWNIQFNNCYACTVTVMAKRTTDLSCAMFKRMFIIKNIDGTTTIQGNVQTIGADINPNAWSVSILPNNTDDVLQIMAIGSPSNTIDWMATLEAERMY